MKRNRKITASLIAAAVLGVSGAALAADRKVDLGKSEFESKCATCHGLKGKGDGPSAGILTKSVPDLTTLSQRNGGVFPMSRVYDTIEGAGVAAHGSRDMPIWGTAYAVKAGEYYFDVPYNSEAYVRARILALAEYVSRLQAK